MMPETVTLAPLGGSNAEHSFAYYGERADWLAALWRSRDSDALARSNWRVIVPEMLTRFPDDAATETFSHWAVGWTEVLLVRPNTPAAEAAQDWADRLDDYPIASDDDFSELEYSEEWCVRCDAGTREAHWDASATCRGSIAYLTFRSADDAEDLRYRWDRREPPAHGYRSTRARVSGTIELGLA